MDDLLFVLALVGEVAVQLVLILALSFLVESAVEWLLGKTLPLLQLSKDAQSVILQFAALGASMFGVFYYGFDVMNALSMAVGGNVPVGYFGEILTGFLVGRGSTAVHDFIVKFFRPLTTK